MASRGTVSHNHRDHAGAADELRKATGAVVAMHPADIGMSSTRSLDAATLDRWGVPEEHRAAYAAIVPPDGPVPDLVLDAGLVLGRGSVRLEVVETPGHTAGQVCILVPDRRLVLTGDHVLPNVNPGGAMGGRYDGNPIRAFLRSLDAMEAYRGWTGLPGHGPVMSDVSTRASAIAAHHRARTRELAEIMAKRPEGTTWEWAAALRWGSGWERLRDAMRLSALRQTDAHAALVRSNDWQS